MHPGGGGGGTQIGVMTALGFHVLSMPPDKQRFRPAGDHDEVVVD